jgi:hypothetical protein
MTLLFRLAEWHALAKLRMHSESTLTLMESVTSALGDIMRKFRNITCPAFKTRELPKETAARARKQARKQAKKASQPEKLPTSGKLNIQSKRPKDKTLNLSTYKVHALADYVGTIRLYGTTDSYSTQTVGICITFSMASLHSCFRENLSTVVLNDFMDAPTRIKLSDKSPGMNAVKLFSSVHVERLQAGSKLLIPIMWVSLRTILYRAATVRCTIIFPIQRSTVKTHSHSPNPFPVIPLQKLVIYF